jgi:hypothetical protein
MPRPLSEQSAARGRLMRLRRKLGILMLSFEMPADTIDDLVKLGWLKTAARTNRDEVEDAFLAFVQQSFAESIRPASNA